jgi:hypothetical protein
MTALSDAIIYNMARRILMRDINSNELEFAISCIEGVAEELGIRGDEVYNIMTTCPGMNILDDYVIAYYDALHTQGRQYVVRELLEVMREKGAEI